MRDDRTALIACAAIRVILLRCSVESALDASLERAGATVSEVERTRILRAARILSERHKQQDKPQQLELAV